MNMCVNVLRYKGFPNRGDEAFLKTVNKPICKKSMESFFYKKNNHLSGKALRIFSKQVSETFLWNLKKFSAEGYKNLTYKHFKNFSKKATKRVLGKTT